MGFIYSDREFALKKTLRAMQLGQSIVIGGIEYIKTKSGFVNTKGQKVTQRWIVEFWKDEEWEVC